MPWPNGLYQATTPASGDRYSMRLRLDLAAGIGATSYASLDLYSGLMTSTTDPDLAPTPNSLLYLASFRTSPLPPAEPGPPELLLVLKEVTAGADSSGTPSTIELKLVADADPSALAFQIVYTPLDVHGTIPASALTFFARRLDGSFHEVALTIDTTPNYPTPYAIASDPSTARPSFEDCFDKAGLRVVRGPIGFGVLPADRSWTIPGLRGQEQAKLQDRPVGWSLDVYLMIATSLADSDDTTGAMFDQSERGAAAVFYDALVSHFGGAGRDFELQSNYLLTAVHEVAHCLNLPHAFERLDVTGSFPTFMNYPQLYMGNPGALDTSRYQGATGWGPNDISIYKRFWSAFTFSFHPQELLDLRHGARRDLVTGGVDPGTQMSVSPYRGQFTGPTTAMSVGGASGAGLELTLRFRGPDRLGAVPAAMRKRRQARDERNRPIFEFGEPIHVEAELRSYLKRPRAVSRRLSAATGDLQIHYQTPDKQFLTYVPPCALCYVPTAKILNGDNVPGEPDSFHKDVCLNLGGRAFRFVTPGLYRVRASYRYHDTVLVSNILELYVRYPTPEVENLIVPLFDEEVAAYLAFRGVGSLTKARDRLREKLLDDSGQPRPDVRHPLRHYFAAYEALLSTRPHSSNTRDIDFLTALSGALDIADLNDLKRPQRASRIDLARLPFSNIGLAKIGRSIHAALESVSGKESLASALAVKLHQALEARGVPAQVRERYLPDRPGTEPPAS